MATAVPNTNEPLWSPDHPDEQTLFNIEMSDVVLPPQTPSKPPASHTLDTLWDYPVLWEAILLI